MTIEEKAIKMLKEKRAKYNEIQDWFSNEYDSRTSSVHTVNKNDIERTKLAIEMQVLTELLLKS